MGLDMHAWAVKSKNEGACPGDITSFGLEVGRPAFYNLVDLIFDRAELHKWRKHPNLHGWMRDLFFDKTAADFSGLPWYEHFNQRPLELGLEDLNALEKAVRSGQLPETEGFFFGESDGSELEDDLEFITKARHAIADGYRVFYDCWY